MKGDSCYDIVDIPDILSTKDRDFLVRNNGDKVKIDSLKDKTICFFIVSLHKNCNYADPLLVLEEVYKELYAKGKFEVVFVAETSDVGGEVGSPKVKKQKIDVEELFQYIFSKMPWLGIPFTDVETRNRLCKLFYSPICEGTGCAILDPKGKVLHKYAKYMLLDFGAEGYPFTKERIKEILEEDQAVEANLCLKTLLGDSPSCDFVIRNDSTKVPISELEDKVVGLYVYSGESKLKQKLVEVYEELQKGKEKFEIVLINLHFYEGYRDANSFMENFKTMPWLALPFMDKRTRKVWWIFDQPGINCFDKEGSFVIIGPGGKFVETYSSTIVEYYGVEAYPFTKEKALEIEKIRHKEVTLDSFLAKANEDYVVKSDGTKIPFSNLKGKTILLFFPYPDREDCSNALPELRKWYEQIKVNDEKFEVIMVSPYTSKESFDNFFSEMPWLAFPHDVPVRSVFFRMLGCWSLSMVAFGADGHLVTKNALVRLQSRGVDAYPFTDDNLDEESFEEMRANLSLY